MQENSDNKLNSKNEVKKINETVSFFDYDLVKEEAKIKTRQIKIQEKENKKIKDISKKFNLINSWNKKQKILFSLFAIGLFLLLISIFKLPYTGAIIDSVVEYFFGWSKYGFYLILILFFATIYFKKIRRHVLRPFIISFLIILTIFSAYLFGAVGYKIINDTNIISFYNNEQTIFERSNFSFDQFVGGWSNTWNQNFIKSINANDYYFINKFAFGGLIGYINIEVFFDNAWIFIVVLSFIVILLFVIAYLVWNIKSKHNFKFKVWFMQWLINHVNKKYKTKYSLTKNDENNVVEITTIESNHHEDEQKNKINVNEANENVNLENSNIKTQNEKIEQNHETTLKKDTIIDKTNELNFQQDTNKSIPQDNNVEELIIKKPSIKTKAFNFDNTKSNLSQDFYEKNYPKISVIKGRSQEYYHEFLNIASTLKENVIKFLDIKNIKYNKQNLRTILNFSSVEVEVNLTENGIYSFFNKYKEEFVDYIKIDDATPLVYNRFGNLIANLKLQKMQHQINIGDIIKEIPYSNDLCIGVGKERKDGTIWLDDRNGSMIIFGSAFGSGKKMLFSGMLLSAIYKKSYNELQIYLVNDNKSKGTKGIENLKHIKKIINYEDVDSILLLTKEIKEIITEQKKLFAQSNVSNINEYNEKNKSNPLPKHIVFISEFNKIIEQKQESRFKSNLISILDVAKEHGIIVILSTDEISQQTTSYINFFNNLIVLKVDDENQSMLIENNNLYSNLDGDGDMYITDRNSGLRKRAQVAKIDSENFELMIEEIKQSNYGLITTTKSFDIDE